MYFKYIFSTKISPDTFFLFEVYFYVVYFFWKKKYNKNTYILYVYIWNTTEKIQKNYQNPVYLGNSNYEIQTPCFTLKTFDLALLKRFRTSNASQKLALKLWQDQWWAHTSANSELLVLFGVLINCEGLTKSEPFNCWSPVVSPIVKEMFVFSTNLKFEKIFSEISWKV